VGHLAAGFYATAGMIDAHPALVAVSRRRPSPIITWATTSTITARSCWRTASASTWGSGIARATPRRPAHAAVRLRHARRLRLLSQLGSLANADEKYFKYQQPMWDMNIGHTSYDEVWQSRAIWNTWRPSSRRSCCGRLVRHEDPQGLLRQFDFMEKNTPPADML